ncbi:hypothetical protein AVEN_636-1 [Araneus ventricosus]|uniref:Uncharacterized protein n=1 Tax=Araneus ventricosus TaxID=182803 RepID=A0A4Y2EL69_ARAVE|nr:hypothetical protein AVEN_636-1 [Araneus ventricosus]
MNQAVGWEVPMQSPILHKKSLLTLQCLMSEQTISNQTLESAEGIEFEDCNDFTKLEILKGLKKATDLRFHSSNGVCILPRACRYLDNLRTLYIANSHVESVRFLGAHYPKVKELALVSCGLRTLDGITSFPNLKSLRLPANEIQEVDNCIYLYQLQHLDVERNLIHDVKSLEWLALCPKLISIVLLNNPLYFLTKEGQINCSDKDVIKLLPKLKYIDGRPLDATAQKLKNFRKFWTPYLTKQEKEYSSQKFSRLSFDINTEYSTAKTSTSTEESKSNETCSFNSLI